MIAIVGGGAWWPRASRDVAYGNVFKSSRCNCNSVKGIFVIS